MQIKYGKGINILYVCNVCHLCANNKKKQLGVEEEDLTAGKESKSRQNFYSW